jgi:hypothetical protein
MRRGVWLALFLGATHPAWAHNAHCGPPSSDPALRLCLSAPEHMAMGRPIHIDWELRNVSHATVRLASHVEAGPRPHFDPLTLRICHRGQTHCHDLALSAARAASVPVWCDVGPGQRLKHRVNLAPWLGLNEITLAPGTYEWQAVYRQNNTQVTPDAAAPEGCMAWLSAAPDPSITGKPAPLWHGELRSGIVSMMISAPP